MKVTVRFLVIIALLGLAIMPMQHATALKTDRHITCHSVDISSENVKPVDVSDEFTTADEKVMAFLELSDINPPIDTLTVWVGPDGTEVGKSEFRVTEWTSLVGYRTLEIEGELPVGEWQHRLYVDGKLVSTARFTLEPSIELVSKTTSHAENDIIYPGNTVTASYELKNTGRTSLRDVEIAVDDLPPNVKLESTSAKSLGPGETEKFELKFEFEKEGEYTIHVQLLVNGYSVKTASGTLTARISPVPFWQNPLVIGGIVAAVAIVLAAVLLMRRRRGMGVKPQAPMQVAPPPPSAMPRAAQPTAPLGATKYCIACGSPIPALALHCSRCGAAQQ